MEGPQLEDPTVFATSPLNFANPWKDVKRTPDQSIISTCDGISYNFWWLCLTFEPIPVNEIDSELDEEEQRELHDYMDYHEIPVIKKSLKHIQIGVQLFALHSTHVLLFVCFLKQWMACGCFPEYITITIQSQNNAHLITMVVGRPCPRASDYHIWPL